MPTLEEMGMKDALNRRIGELSRWPAATGYVGTCVDFQTSASPSGRTGCRSGSGVPSAVGSGIKTQKSRRGDDNFFDYPRKSSCIFRSKSLFKMEEGGVEEK